MKEKVKIGILGGAGLAAGELVRLLLQHPNTHIQFIQSSSQAGKKVSYCHPDLEGECNLVFTDTWQPDVDVLFICKGHGQSRKFLEENHVPKNIKVIDLSQDFRLRTSRTIQGREFVYGLPELNRELIKEADSIANPGCFATAIELALIPLATTVVNDIHIHSITGSTGAGQGLSVTSLFSWRDNNISTYKVFEHQHLDEITETLQRLNPGFDSRLYMVPVRGNYARGIFTTLYTSTSLSGEEIRNHYRSYYGDSHFVRINGDQVYLKKVVNTNNAFISIRKNADNVFIECVIDNLLKGAAGQAVQNMNIMLRFEESTGLRLKPSAY
ncbi:MAG TPA: N-acetyl-gamma-glutamyl-phosphate reductase [Cyclobacteriaceae bacterium]|nr:N-acetyl-gamma-glutamyl-phosphate reductase [Cyclobacteriaceae bacterium]